MTVNKHFKIQCEIFHWHFAHLILAFVSSDRESIVIIHLANWFYTTHDEQQDEEKENFLPFNGNIQLPTCDDARTQNEY